MRFRDLIRTVVSNLKRMRFRVLLTVAGVVIGTASVVLMIAIGAGMQRSLTSQLDVFGRATQVTVYPAGENPFMAGDPTAATRRAKRLDDAALREIERLPSVSSVMGQYVMSAEVTFRTQRTGVQVYAVEPAALRDLGLPVAEGRELRSGNEIIVGDAVPGLFVGNLFGGEGPRADVLNQRVSLEVMRTDPSADEPSTSRSLRVRVAGVFEPVDFDADYSVYLPISTARPVLGQDARRGYQQAVVQAVDAESVDALTQQIGELGFDAFSLRAQVEALQQVFVIIQLVLAGIGGIALVVASLGIANTMTMATYERTREIGIMKALGASQRQIMRIFLMESGAIGVIGGVTGLVLSVALAVLGNLAIAPSLQGESLFYIPLWLAVFAVVFSAAVGLAAGVLPAMRAARLDPLVALRHE